MATDVMTVDEVADYLRIKRQAGHGLAADSRLPCLKVDGIWRLRRADIGYWIKRQASPKKDRNR